MYSVGEEPFWSSLWCLEMSSTVCKNGRNNWPSLQKPCRALFALTRASSLFYHAPVASEDLGEFMETKGASSPGILVLTTGLSKPFMRLDKYPTLLKELERHMEVLPPSNPESLSKEGWHGSDCCIISNSF